MKFKWAVLNVLAKWPDRHVTFAEIRREARLILETGSLIDQERFSELGDIDLLESGLVLIDDVGIQITDAGLSLLGSVKGFAGRPPAASSSSTSYQAALFDSEIGAEDRLKIFDFEMRRLEEEEEKSMQIPRHDATMYDRVFKRAGKIDDRISAVNEPADPLASDKVEQTEPIKFIDSSPENAPAFLQWSFAARAWHAGRNPPDWLAGFIAATANRARSLARLWRGHVVHDTSYPKAERVAGNARAAILAFLSLVVVLACAAAAIALVQIKSLKTEIAALHRELGPLKERLAKLEQAEKAKKEAGEKAIAEKESRLDQSGLSFSREEIQLIRDFIKPSPASGTPAPAINVGDPVSFATIPLPSSLMEKVPKLLGGRFTTRNGSIIILRRDSRQADAVLPPN